MAAVGKFVLWGKENLCLIRSQGGALVLETLFFAEDVRSKKEIEDVVGETAVAEAELQLAGQVISSLSGEWAPEDFANDYREDLKHMLEEKLAGHEVVAPEPVAETPVIDLMEALRQSVADAQGRRAQGGSKSSGGSENGKAGAKAGSRSRKTPARKSA
jgi:DNA end-binding protein Ku